jgi:hypothetical protein
VGKRHLVVKGGGRWNYIVWVTPVDPPRKTPPGNPQDVDVVEHEQFLSSKDRWAHKDIDFPSSRVTSTKQSLINL